MLPRSPILPPGAEKRRIEAVVNNAIARAQRPQSTRDVMVREYPNGTIVSPVVRTTAVSSAVTYGPLTVAVGYPEWISDPPSVDQANGEFLFYVRIGSVNGIFPEDMVGSLGGGMLTPFSVHWTGPGPVTIGSVYIKVYFDESGASIYKAELVDQSKVELAPSSPENLIWFIPVGSAVISRSIDYDRGVVSFTASVTNDGGGNFAAALYPAYTTCFFVTGSTPPAAGSVHTAIAYWRI